MDQIVKLRLMCFDAKGRSQSQLATLLNAGDTLKPSEFNQVATIQPYAIVSLEETDGKILWVKFSLTYQGQEKFPHYKDVVVPTTQTLVMGDPFNVRVLVQQGLLLGEWGVNAAFATPTLNLWNQVKQQRPGEAIAYKLGYSNPYRLEWNIAQPLGDPNLNRFGMRRRRDDSATDKGRRIDLSDF